MSAVEFPRGKHTVFLKRKKNALDAWSCFGVWRLEREKEKKSERESEGGREGERERQGGEGGEREVEQESESARGIVPEG